MKKKGINKIFKNKKKFYKQKHAHAHNRRFNKVITSFIERTTLQHQCRKVANKIVKKKNKKKNKNVHFSLAKRF